MHFAIFSKNFPKYGKMVLRNITSINELYSNENIQIQLFDNFNKIIIFHVHGT